MELNSLHKLFIDELKDIYDAENRIVTALPRMASAASSPELKECFEDHLEESRGHIRRLDQIFNKLGESPLGEKCEGMEGLLREGEATIHKQGDPAVKDAALIAAAQRIEHYEMAVYGTLKAFAKHLKQSEAEDLIDQSLSEEKEADKKLTKIAQGSLISTGINKEAKRS